MCRMCWLNCCPCCCYPHTTATTTRYAAVSSGRQYDVIGWLVLTMIMMMMTSRSTKRSNCHKQMLGFPRYRRQRVSGWTFHRSGTGTTGKLFIDGAWVRVRVTFSEMQWAGTGAGTFRILMGGHGYTFWAKSHALICIHLLRFATKVRGSILILVSRAVLNTHFA